MSAELKSMPASDGVAAVDRAFAILAAVAGDAEPSTLSEIARVTGFYKSTILRLLSSLDSAGFVHRLRDGRYALGASAFRLGLAYERQNPVSQQVLPVLQDLVGHGTESASFHVAHGPETRLCLFRVDSNHSTLDRVAAGDVLPLARGAAGRVLLAYSGQEGPEAAAVRRAGYALSRGERDPSCAGLAAPVLGPGGDIAGAVSLSGPGERFSDAAVASMLKLLLAAAEGLTRALGGRPPLKTRAAS